MCFIFLSIKKFFSSTKKDNSKKIQNPILKTPFYIEPHLPIPLNYN